MRILSRAPCRISLAGGGTDVDPFASVHGGQVLNLAINLYHTVTLNPVPGSEITLEALGEQRSLWLADSPFVYGEDRKFDLLRAIINFFLKKIPSGFCLRVDSPVFNALGLGRSGSVAAAVIGAFNEWLKMEMSRLEIGFLASRLEIEELGWPGGRQDPLVAVFGGVHHMLFGPGNAVSVNRLPLSQDSMEALHQRTLMVFVKGDRYSSDQQKGFVRSMSDVEKLEAMMNLKNSVPLATAALRAQAWSELGRILHEGWENKKKSNPLVTNNTIDRFYSLALQHGAYGGKISGSGAAGSMLFLIPSERKRRAGQAFAAAGAEIVDFSFDEDGLVVQTLYDD